MNFFEQQDDNRRQSLALLGAFLIAMLCMGGVIQLVIVGFSRLLGQGGHFFQPSLPAIAMITIVWLAVLAGGFFRYLDVKGGGPVLARRFGAVHASDRARYEKEQRLLNIAAEIAIASSTPQPEIYVLRQENSINAFVLGTSEQKYAIVVTQGALNAFDRTELQAVVAHEFAHIKNGDMPLNMRLLITMGGLMAIYEIGCLLTGKVSMATGKPLFVHPGLIVGFLLRALGSLGVLSGKLICAAFLRQREYLADAAAVQFTRNTMALATALDIIRLHRSDPELHNLHRQELSHLCFQSGSQLTWYKRLLASHPPLQSRIDAIDRHFSIKRRKQGGTKPDVLTRENASIPADSRQCEGDAKSMLEGQFFDIHVRGERVIDYEGRSRGMSDRIVLLLPDESSCLAVLFALFSGEGEQQRAAYYNALSLSFNNEFTERVRAVAKLMPDEMRNDQIGIIDHACGILQKVLKHENRQRLLLKLERLLDNHGNYDLMSYAKLQLVRRKLDVDFPLLESIANDKVQFAQARCAKTFDAMGSEFALLLSLVVESSGAASSVQDAEFERVLKCYTQTRYPRRTANETGIVKELETAFQTLYVQPKPIRQAFVQHCLEIVRQDGYVARGERVLLDLFAASLDCEELAA